MTDPTPEGEAMVEAVARIIDPSSWSVLDGYLAQTKRKYAGQNVGWPVEQYQHTDSMANARKIIAALRPAIEAEIVAWLQSPTPAMWEAAWNASQDYFVADDISKRGLEAALKAFVAPAIRQQKGRTDGKK